MATITNIEPKTYQGKVTGHIITLDTGITGYLDDKQSSADLRVGEEVSYSLTVKKNKQGKDYNLLTISRVFSGGAQPPVPPVNVPENAPQVAKTTSIPTQGLPTAQIDIAKWKFDSRMQLCKLTHDLIIAGKFSDEEGVLHLGRWTTEMDNLIDGIFS